MLNSSLPTLFAHKKGHHYDGQTHPSSRNTTFNYYLRPANIIGRPAFLHSITSAQEELTARVVVLTYQVQRAITRGKQALVLIGKVNDFKGQR